MSYPIDIKTKGRYKDMVIKDNVCYIEEAENRLTKADDTAALIHCFNKMMDNTYLSTQLKSVADQKDLTDEVKQCHFIIKDIISKDAPKLKNKISTYFDTMSSMLTTDVTIGKYFDNTQLWTDVSDIYWLIAEKMIYHNSEDDFDTLISTTSGVMFKIYLRSRTVYNIFITHFMNILNNVISKVSGKPLCTRMIDTINKGAVKKGFRQLKNRTIEEDQNLSVKQEIGFLYVEYFFICIKGCYMSLNDTDNKILDNTDKFLTYCNKGYITEYNTNYSAYMNKKYEGYLRGFKKDLFNYDNDYVLPLKYVVADNTSDYRKRKKIAKKMGMGKSFPKIHGLEKQKRNNKTRFLGKTVLLIASIFIILKVIEILTIKKILIGVFIALWAMGNINAEMYTDHKGHTFYKF